MRHLIRLLLPTPADAMVGNSWRLPRPWFGALASVTVLAASCAPPRSACRVQEACADAGVHASCQRADCGANVKVTTTLEVGTPLTTDECDRICAPVWCGSEPITRHSTSPGGCSLVAPDTVRCDAVVSDCGWPPPCVSAYCPGACRQPAGPPCCGEPLRPECAANSVCGDCPPPDPRCTVDACRGYAACGGRLSTEAAPSTCADADGGIDPTFDTAALCVDACNAGHAGDRLDCDGGVRGHDAGLGVNSCGDACIGIRARCDDACPRSSFAECMTCAARCGVAFGQCWRGCGLSF